MKSEEIFINLERNTIVLTTNDWEESINVDEITSIDYSNLFGELITVSTLLNRIGILRAEAESIAKLEKLELEIYESELRKSTRREAVVQEGKINIGTTKVPRLIKFTESALDEYISGDEGYQIKKKNLIKKERDFAIVDNLFWSINSKSKKLENLIKPVTPEEFEKSIIEGKVNQILIKKKERVYPDKF